MKAQVVWHDVECHGYVADLPLWRDLARAEGGPVLDVGAGTGRVALDLAAAGSEVVALDSDPVLLEALAERAAERGLEVETVADDAQDFDLGAGRFALVLVPMQTIQLFAHRDAFLRCARRALRPGGLLAIAIADDLQSFEPEDPALLPAPDVAVVGGLRYESQPVAVRIAGGGFRIERVRTIESPDGERRSEPEAIELAMLDAPGLAAEGRAAGFTVVPGERITPTADHVGSAVVMLRA